MSRAVNNREDNGSPLPKIMATKMNRADVVETLSLGGIRIRRQSRKE